MLNRLVLIFCVLLCVASAVYAASPAKSSSNKKAVHHHIHFKVIVPDISNLALNKPTNQSSNLLPSTFASQGADGRTDTFFHTLKENNPWWEINLQQPSSVSHVHIFNRRDCCHDRVVPFQVILFSPEHLEVARHTFNQVKAVFIWSDLVVSDVQYVRIEVPRFDWLQLSEVEVYGYTDEALAAKRYEAEAVAINRKRAREAIEHRVAAARRQRMAVEHELRQMEIDTKSALETARSLGQQDIVTYRRERERLAKEIESRKAEHETEMLNLKHELNARLAKLDQDARLAHEKSVLRMLALQKSISDRHASLKASLENEMNNMTTSSEEQIKAETTLRANELIAKLKNATTLAEQRDLEKQLHDVQMAGVNLIKSADVQRQSKEKEIVASENLMSEQERRQLIALRHQVQVIDDDYARQMDDERKLSNERIARAEQQSEMDVNALEDELALLQTRQSGVDERVGERIKQVMKEQSIKKDRLAKLLEEMQSAENHADLELKEYNEQQKQVDLQQVNLARTRRDEEIAREVLAIKSFKELAQKEGGMPPVMDPVLEEQLATMPVA